MKIDIGGGTKALPGHVNLDPHHGDGVWSRFAQQVPWPCADNSVEAVYASHVLEHIAAGVDRIVVFNEVHRVLIPDGTFEVRVPLFPHWPAVADPTHLSFWVRQSFTYFTSEKHSTNYGYRRWRELSWKEQEAGQEGRWVGTPA